MARFIDADKLNDTYYGLYHHGTMAVKSVLGVFKRLLDEQPTADVEEVKHGEWRQGVPYVCSICGKPAPDEKNTSERYSCWTSPYCPHCGAKMDGEKR